MLVVRFRQLDLCRCDVWSGNMRGVGVVCASGDIPDAGVRVGET